MPAALLLLPWLPHLSEMAQAAISSVVQPWAALCKAAVHSLMARLLRWIRGKHLSEAELLRKCRAESAGGTGRSSCCGGGCPAGQMDDVKSLDRRASHDQTEQNYLQMQKKSKRVGESRNTERIKSSALASSWEECQGNNNLPGL